MGVLTFLVSDAQKDFCSLGKIFLNDEIVEKMKAKLDENELREWLVLSEGHFNVLGKAIDENDAATARKASEDILSGVRFATHIAAVAIKWMQAHPDWRFMTDVDEAYDDVYLADDADDAKEFTEEFGEDAGAIYLKSGSIYTDGDDDDEDDEDDE